MLPILCNLSGQVGLFTTGYTHMQDTLIVATSHTRAGKYNAYVYISNKHWVDFKGNL